MKKKLLLSSILIFIFNGCFFWPSSKVPQKEQIKIPSDAPDWLIKKKLKHHISSIGFSEIVNKKELDFYKQKALIGASNNLTKKIYIKTVNLYKDYLEQLDNPKIFDKDIKKIAKQVSLKSLKSSKIKNIWIKSNKKLYIQIGINSKTVAKEIQNSSKLLFKIDKKLYQNFLSNRAGENIIKQIEE